MKWLRSNTTPIVFTSSAGEINGPFQSHLYSLISNSCIHHDFNKQFSNVLGPIESKNTEQMGRKESRLPPAPYG